LDKKNKNFVMIDHIMFDIISRYNISETQKRMLTLLIYKFNRWRSYQIGYSPSIWLKEEFINCEKRTFYRCISLFEYLDIVKKVDVIDDDHKFINSKTGKPLRNWISNDYKIKLILNDVSQWYLPIDIVKKFINDYNESGDRSVKVFNIAIDNKKCEYGIEKRTITYDIKKGELK